MTLDEYQKLAADTTQTYSLEDKKHFILGYLGLAGEAGTVLTTLKKLLRDGEGFGSFNNKLKEELGDVLWYIASIATHNSISLKEIAKENIEKTRDRFKKVNILDIPRLDKAYEERFPDSFEVNFVEEQGEHFPEVRMNWSGGYLGDPLTDNSREPNDYRYHDVFHLGYVGFLGWSPVLRQLMKLKRKSDHITLNAEDRGRPQVAEEAISLVIYNYAQGNKMLKESERLDTELLRTIKQLVKGLEVESVSAYHWEVTIIESLYASDKAHISW